MSVVNYETYVNEFPALSTDLKNLEDRSTSVSPLVTTTTNTNPILTVKENQTASLSNGNSEIEEEQTPEPFVFQLYEIDKVFQSLAKSRAAPNHNNHNNHHHHHNNNTNNNNNNNNGQAMANNNRHHNNHRYNDVRRLNSTFINANNNSNNNNHKALYKDQNFDTGNYQPSFSGYARQHQQQQQQQQQYQNRGNNNKHIFTGSAAASLQDHIPPYSLHPELLIDRTISNNSPILQNNNSSRINTSTLSLAGNLPSQYTQHQTPLQQQQQQQQQQFQQLQQQQHYPASTPTNASSSSSLLNNSGILQQPQQQSQLSTVSLTNELNLNNFNAGFKIPLDLFANVDKNNSSTLLASTGNNDSNLTNYYSNSSFNQIQQPQQLQTQTQTQTQLQQKYWNNNEDINNPAISMVSTGDNDKSLGSSWSKVWNV
ncbi:hypothetical protein PACTADRAFT_52024 [Pachysolen tannophilus NRRL Y-2460]|uniref:Uncharacterized protein n=1 Tax=Pachysolen tannophilus NRRL Y-2460 TaxID=669874 RepID=A0A1E4TNU2_PACTA|nr:hypothetical protein PACTADRAFT_52024 [Pachysolen tannophilus NRRL Y-2460]